MFLLITTLLAVEGYFPYQVKGIDVLYKKINVITKKKGFRKNFKRDSRRKSTFCLFIFCIDGKIIIGSAGRSA